VIAGAVVVASGLVHSHKSADNAKLVNNNSMGMHTNANASYTLNLLSGKTYTANKPTTLRFNVAEDGTTFKNFAVDSTKLMHLIVVRKDRSNFQHVHPAFDSKTGVFTMSNFQFPTDGQYRVYANFAPTNAKKDAMGMTETEAPYVDVTVGNASSVANQPLGDDSLTSTVNGLTAAIVVPPSDDSPSAATTPTFYAGQDSTVEIEVTQNGTDFKSLQTYLGNLGHMVILGPNLEFIHAHPTANDVSNQSGYVPFMVTFPVSGQYRIYLQTQASNAVSTFSFNVTVQDQPKATDSISGMGM
jgi:hypothetical protein